MPVMLSPAGYRQEDLEFDANLDYIVTVNYIVYGETLPHKRGWKKGEGGSGEGEENGNN